MIVVLENGEYTYINKDDIISFNPVEGYIRVKIVIFFILKLTFTKKVNVLCCWMSDNKDKLIEIINKGE